MEAATCGAVELHSTVYSTVSNLIINTHGTYGTANIIRYVFQAIYCKIICIMMSHIMHFMI